MAGNGRGSRAGASTDLPKGAGSGDDELRDDGVAADTKGDGDDDEGLEKKGRREMTARGGSPEDERANDRGNDSGDVMMDDGG